MSSEQPPGPTLDQLAESLPPAESRLLEINLATQGFRYYEDDRLVLAGPVSSGTPEHPTPSGSFRVLSKDKNKVSRSYTNYYGLPTPMPYSMQFRGPYFLHEGWVPGHADSHGCVRLHQEDARFLYGRMRVGDPIQISPAPDQGHWQDSTASGGLDTEWLSLDEPRRGS
jgi:lipoprotein-anchoring transpeptidase ErfK/SrfK